HRHTRCAARRDDLAFESIICTAFSRHSERKDIFRKPRKGNVIGGVHKSGGLYLGGWKSEDSDAAYKKKVEDRRGK
ncbi:MAG: hypothetical protein ACPGRV_01915, partial [Candidatus Thalassarchaeaceae archaeon]